MERPSSLRAVSQAVILTLALIPSASAHSWVEWAYKVAPNGTMVGDMGYARGYVPRNSTDPLYTDTIPQWILPESGQSAYTGDEVLNKYKLDPNPQFPMLEAAAGDYIALMHLENGHTTLPENQPNKPRNRGTIFFYGTSEPKDDEKLFDVHLVWNKDGTGGDGRGRLLGTRNYDDGQCYQPNASNLNLERAGELASDGAIATQELACQSDLKLPDDLKPGSTFTIYWYWDWPDLNADAIDVEATTNGLFPWAGTFMRGEKDPNGFTIDAIARNESYSSVVDIKITGAAADSFTAKGEVAKDWVSDQDVYSKAIKEQLDNNFQVDIDANGGGGGNGGDSGDAPATTTPSTPTGTTGAGDGAVTVTVTATVPPTTLVTTVYKTVPADSVTSQPAPPAESSGAQSTSTVMVTLTTHVQSASTLMVTMTTHVPGGTQPAATQPTEGAEETSAPADTAPTTVASGGRPEVTPFLRAKRSYWGFGNN